MMSGDGGPFSFYERDIAAVAAKKERAKQHREDKNRFQACLHVLPPPAFMPTNTALALEVLATVPEAQLCWIPFCFVQ